MNRNVSFALLLLSLTFVAACSSGSDGTKPNSNDDDGACTVVGTWKETAAVFKGDPDTLCEALSEKGNSGSYSLKTREITSSSAGEYKVSGEGTDQATFKDSPDSCNLTAKAPSFTEKLSNDVTYTHTFDEPVTVAIEGSTATVVQIDEISTMPKQDGTPCKYTITLTLERQ